MNEQLQLYTELKPSAWTDATWMPMWTKYKVTTRINVTNECNDGDFPTSEFGIRKRVSLEAHPSDPKKAMLNLELAILR